MEFWILRKIFIIRYLSLASSSWSEDHSFSTNEYRHYWSFGWRRMVAYSECWQMGIISSIGRSEEWKYLTKLSPLTHLCAGAIRKGGAKLHSNAIAGPEVGTENGHWQDASQKIRKLQRIGLTEICGSDMVSRWQLFKKDMSQCLMPSRTDTGWVLWGVWVKVFPSQVE